MHLGGKRRWVPLTYSNLLEEAHFFPYICLPLIEEVQAQFVAECQF